MYGLSNEACCESSAVYLLFILQLKAFKIEDWPIIVGSTAQNCFIPPVLYKF